MIDRRHPFFIRIYYFRLAKISTTRSQRERHSPFQIFETEDEICKRYRWKNKHGDLCDSSGSFSKTRGIFGCLSSLSHFHHYKSYLTSTEIPSLTLNLLILLSGRTHNLYPSSTSSKHFLLPQFECKQLFPSSAKIMRCK